MRLFARDPWMHFLRTHAILHFFPLHSSQSFHVPNSIIIWFGAEHLQIVDGLHHRDIFLCPRQNHGRGKLEIDVVEVDDVRVEAVDNLPHLRRASPE